jgi:hypothetical protein
MPLGNQLRRRHRKMLSEMQQAMDSHGDQGEAAGADDGLTDHLAKRHTPRVARLIAMRARVLDHPLRLTSLGP